MSAEDRIIEEQARPEDIVFDQTLRPKSLDDFMGQNKVKEKLRIYIEAARQRNESPDHILFFGPPGLGKTTLAHIVANELGVNIKATSGPVLERPGDLVGLLTNLEKGDILFIDEIHRLNHVVEEYLYPAMEDFYLDVVIDKGPNARSVKINLQPFTILGATTRSGLLSSPLRDRFGIVERLDHYGIEELQRIVTRAAAILNIEIDTEGSLEIAGRSRGTPRVANRILRRVRDFAQVRADGAITQKVAQDALKLLDVDTLGLDEMDKRILKCLIQQFNGGPVGASSLAIAVGEEAETLEEIYEPYLIKSGLIKRTPSGRVATKLAYDHFSITPPEKSAELF